ACEYMYFCVVVVMECWGVCVCVCVCVCVRTLKCSRAREWGGCVAVNQTESVSIKQRVCQSNRECVNQIDNVSIKQRVCQSNRECVNQTESVSIKQRVCQSNRERVNQTYNVSIKQTVCQSNRECVNQTESVSHLSSLGSGLQQPGGQSAINTTVLCTAQGECV